MQAYIKLHLRENIKGRSFILFAIIGGLISLLISSGDSVSISVDDTETLVSKYGVSLRVLAMIAGFAAVMVSMTTVDNHRRDKRHELLQLHGMPLDQQVLGIGIGNSLVAMALAGVISLGFILECLISQAPTNILGLTAAMGLFLIANGLIALLTTLLSFFLPPVIVAVAGIFIVIVGSFHQVFLGQLLNSRTWLSALGARLLHLLPPLDKLNRLSRDFFFLEFNDSQALLLGLLYLWATISLLYLISKGAKRHGKI